MMDKKIILDLAEKLNEGFYYHNGEDNDLLLETCIELLKDLETNLSKVSSTSTLLVQEDNDTMKTLEKLLNRSIRSFKRHKRTSSSSSPSSSFVTAATTTTSSKGKKKINNNNNKNSQPTSCTTWDDAIQKCNDILMDMNNKKKQQAAVAAAAAAVAAAKKSNQHQKKVGKTSTSKNADVDDCDELPTSVSDYRSRLISQKKKLYKDPPVLPPTNVIIESKTYPLPKRDKKTGLLSFVVATDDDDSSMNKLIKDFHPNRTPEEVLRSGAFGGTYFRPIVSAVTNKRYNSNDVIKDTLQKEWIEGMDKSTMLSSTKYREHINKYGVSCGGCLGMWESSGWIVDIDPYGWFQWYCRFYNGRRCSDDVRQISRWLKSAGPKGRFRSQLCNKILIANTKHDDESISPVIRQTLLHWGLEITEDVLTKHKKRVGR